jgi:hypothetical protein
MVHFLMLPASLASLIYLQTLLYLTLHIPTILWETNEYSVGYGSDLSPDILPPTRPSPTTSSNTLDYVLQVHLHTRLITASHGTSEGT